MKLFDDIVDRVKVIVYDVHDGDRSYVAGLEDGVSFGIDDGIVGVDLCIDELFHDKQDICRFFNEKLFQIAIAFQAPGHGCAYTVIRFNDNRITYL